MFAFGSGTDVLGQAPMSALPRKADITERDWHVRFVPKADIRVMPRVLNSLGG